MDKKAPRIVGTKGSVDEMRVVFKVMLCLSITAFWIVMMGFLARREWASAPPAMDEEGLAATDMPRLSRLGIFLEGNKIGVAQIHYMPMANRTTVIRTHVKLLGLAAFGNGLEAGAIMSLGADKKLASFSARFGSAEQTGGPIYAVRGTVIGDEMEIVYSLGGQVNRQRIPFQGDAFFSSSLTPLLSGLKVAPGQRRPVALWNPITRRMDTAWIENKGKTRLLWHRHWRDLEELQLTYGDITLSAWVTDQGDVIRQEAPFGLVLEKEEE
jgi:hypothetical protein